MRIGGGQAKDMQRRRQPRIPTVVRSPNGVNIPRSTRTTGGFRPLRARLRHALVPPLGDGRVRVGSTASVLPFLRSLRFGVNSGNGGPVVAGIGTGVIQASKRRFGSCMRGTSRNVRFGSKADILCCGSHVRFTPESGPGEKGEPRPELNEHCRNGHGKEFYFVPTHSLMKRARSFVSIFCCSARLAHSRIFCAFSCGIIFSGAVAFIGPGNCADAAFANIATPKDSA